MEHSYGFEHVAQQSRRDKLRVSRNSDEQLSFQNSGHSGLDLDLVRIQNFNKNSILPSVMINFSRDSDIMLSQELVGDASLGSVSNYWKSSDWEMNCGNNCLGGEMLNDSTVYTLQDVVNQTAACEGRGNESNVLPYDTTGFVSDSNPQRLALSLSSNTQFQESEESKTVKSETIGNKNYGKSLQNMMGVSVNPYRNTGPLGPFIGYATILKSSKFLKPAQLLLDEFCSSNAHKFVQPCESSPALNADDETNISGVGSISSESHQPEYQKKKAKLLYMLDEVCRRYKQYHQQMQMVVSSFESVAGLSSATPYISLALKTVSRHFQSLKNAISEQLKYLRKVVGEDSSSISAGTSGRKYMEQSFQKQKTGIVNIGFLESQNVWRPHRGLPERAVAILRAWLFEHFLHPYPTDTDKHMLATQTGLSRNQVSNWFINARVRVWKPMVEEIHMLETNGMAEMNNKGHVTIENTAGWTSSEQQPLKSHGDVNEIITSQWDQGKPSRLDNGVQSNTEGELMGFVPYRASAVDVGGVGTVSLTLGLRHRVESAHHQQQQQDEQLLRHYGSEMIHDFVG
ncbi:BEL1-like homeodomain protein 8 [Cucurbita maxima]|uniref:BEL1-like homeodomain protein 8 n=1 Tax=Cucurbita maxima TaxID=3661 RepID=A0A6J1I087_CUCMA|nr:BEL1-like homeodomain protein 8 [Cucurbita maxima]